MKVRLTFGILILSLVAGMSLAKQTAVSAQESEEATPAPTVTREVAEDDAEADEAEDDGNFLPTEKINIDSSVSFPVDI